MTLEIEYSPEADTVYMTLDNITTISAQKQSSSSIKYKGFNKIDDEPLIDALKNIASILLQLTT